MGGGAVPKVPAAVGMEMGAIDDDATLVVVELAVGVELPHAVAATAMLAVSTRAAVRVERMGRVLSW
jgi:hypothetical protein